MTRYCRGVNEHYFSSHEEPAASEADIDFGSLRDVSVHARGHHLKLKTADRVFSADRLDLGTEQLLNKAPALPGSGTFLDLGCGWGAVAVVMAIEVPDATVWAVDVNHRALALTKLNAKESGAKNIVTLEANKALTRARDEGIRFDVIWSNPPVRIGKTAMREMLLQWLDLLSTDGAAYFVVNRHLGADSLVTWLATQGFQASRIASRKGFRILQVTRV